MQELRMSSWVIKDTLGVMRERGGALGVFGVRKPRGGVYFKKHDAVSLSEMYSKELPRIQLSLEAIHLKCVPIGISLWFSPGD